MKGLALLNAYKELVNIVFCLWRLLLMWEINNKSITNVRGAPQALLSMGLSRQEYWSRLPCPPVGDLPNPGIKPRSPTLQADSLPFELPGKLKFKIALLLIPKTLLFFSEQKQLSLQFFNFLTREKPTLHFPCVLNPLDSSPSCSSTAPIPIEFASPSSSVSHFQKHI